MRCGKSERVNPAEGRGGMGTGGLKLSKQAPQRIMPWWAIQYKSQPLQQRDKKVMKHQSFDNKAGDGELKPSEPL